MSTPKFFTPDRVEPDFKSAATLDEAIAQKKAYELQLLKDSVFICTGSVMGRGCGQFLKVGETPAIQTHYYVSAYGCTGGDYWSAGEAHLVCTACGNRNRLMDDGELWKKYRKAVKSISEEHKE